LGQQFGLFAAAASGEHRLWISRLNVAAENISMREGNVQTDVERSGGSLEPTGFSQAGSVWSTDLWTAAQREELCVIGVKDDACNFAEVAPESESISHQQCDEESSFARVANRYRHVEDKPAPPKHQLEALISRTELEIEMLEHEAMRCARDDQGVEEEMERPQPLPAPMPLPTLEVPTPPKISRLGRGHVLDPKWVRAQRELVDPVDVTRSYLDRACRPQPKPVQPHWVTIKAADSRRKAQSQETAVSRLSYDPLEIHVKSLCQPW
jgi:hypothetical protein